MSTSLKIAIAEPSAIIRLGLETLFKKLHGFQFQFIEIEAAESLIDSLRNHQPNLLLINPGFPGFFSLQTIKEEARCQDIKCVALIYGMTDQALTRQYDDLISIYDSADEIRHKLERLHAIEEKEEADEEQQSLSQREKEIVVCVVKGMTNREIADQLFLSTHTVITH